MLTATLAIARNTLTESIRQPIYLVLLLLVSVVFVLGLTTSAYTFSDDSLQMIVMGLGMVLVGGTTLAALVATGVLSREIGNRTVLTVISKPVGRPLFVIGKYLGVSGAIGLAMWVWAMVFLLTVRHKVLSAAGDQIDMPVIVFGLSAFAVAAIVAVWGNYFYRWVFASTFTRTLAVTITLAYLLVLLIDKQWQFQAIYTEFDPELAPVTNYGEVKKSLGQVVLALVLVIEAVGVLTAVAIAASTRLGQVMTLIIALGFVALGVASDGLFGRHADTSDVAAAFYHGLPNLQFSFMADALTQQSSITLSYLGMATAYNAAFIIAILAIAVALFQTRETG